MGQLEAAELLRVRAREGALLVAEQLGLHQGFGDRRDVDGHEGLPAAFAARVDRSRDQLLAGAALAGDQHRGRRRRDLRDELIDARHLRVAADHSLERPREAVRVGRPAGQRGAQIQYLALERALVERALSQHQDVVDVEGLGQIVVGAALERFDGGSELADRGGDDHDRRRVGRLDARQHVDAELAGHPLIEHHEVDLVGLQELERLGAVGRLEDVARLFEDRPHGGAYAFLVVDDEDRAAAGRLRVGGGHRWRERSIVRY